MGTAADKIVVARVGEIAAGRNVVVRLKGGAEVVVFRVGDEYCAVENHCPHQHFARLHEGTLEGSVITCPMHGWSFDVRTGAPVNAGGRLLCHRVEVQNDQILLELVKGDGGNSWQA